MPFASTPVELTDDDIDMIVDVLVPQPEIDYGWSLQERARMNRIFERYEEQLSEAEYSTFSAVLSDMEDRPKRAPESHYYHFYQSHGLQKAILLGKLKDARG